MYMYIYIVWYCLAGREKSFVYYYRRLVVPFFAEMRWRLGKYLAVAIISWTTSEPQQKTQCYYWKRSSVLIYLRLCRENARSKSIVVVVVGASSTQCMRSPTCFSSVWYYLYSMEVVLAVEASSTVVGVMTLTNLSTYICTAVSVVVRNCCTPVPSISDFADRFQV